VTGIKVVDASALAAILLAEAEAEAIGERLTGARLAAASLLCQESANICRTKIKRQPSRRDALRAAFRLARA
jgi:predicted nucleic acid-binding protein